MESEDAVWAETTDGGLLKQLFGCYPTLHDARIVSLEVDRTHDWIAMLVDYRDSPGSDDEAILSARIQLRWSGIRSFRMPIGDSDLLSIDFARKDHLVVTSLETSPGVFGTVVSDAFEAVLVQLDPGEPEEDTWLSIL